MNATLQPSRSRQRLKKAHLGLRFAITAFVFVAIIAVVSLAAFAVRGALVRRGLDFRSVAQGIVRYLERARLAVAREARESGASGRQNSTGDVAATAALRPSSEGLAPLGVNLRASSPAIRASRASAVRDAVAFEEFCSLPPGVAGVNDAGRAQSAFELVNAWTAEQRAKLVAAAPCSWAMHQQSEIRLPPVPLCEDALISAAFVKWGWWGGNIEHLLMLSGGYLAGTPLTAAHSGLLRKAARDAQKAGRDAGSLAALVVAASLPPMVPEDRAQSWCSRERPVVLDLGAHLGQFSDAAGAAGCTVIMLEPLLSNVAHLWQTIEKNGWQEQVLLLHNAVAAGAPHEVEVVQQRGNPGSAAVERISEDNGGMLTGEERERVFTVLLDDLFDGGSERPRHPFFDRPIAPKDVAAIKIDVEGYDVAALWGLRATIEAGRPPLIKAEFILGSIADVSGCDVLGFLRWLYALGYHTYSVDVTPPRPLELKDWESTILPLLHEGKAGELETKHGISAQGLAELMAVHDSAPVPALFGCSGPGGLSPV